MWDVLRKYGNLPKFMNPLRQFHTLIMPRVVVVGGQKWEPFNVKKKVRRSARKRFRTRARFYQTGCGRDRRLNQVWVDAIGGH